LLSWCEDQFRKLGAGDASERCALNLVSALQGVSLTAPVFGVADLISKAAQNLEQWLCPLQTDSV
jgi:hypothetical protein